MNQSLQNWIEEHLLQVTVINEHKIEIPDIGKFLIIEPKNIQVQRENLVELVNDVVFDEEFQLVLNEIESEQSEDVDFILFQFGNGWYYTDSLTPEEIIPFKYIGKPNITFDKSFPYIGIHGEYELCNGSRQYKDWIKKAKFLGATTLGICEENTLAGTLAFQSECLKAGIKPIIGETITILTDTKAKINIKLYVADQEGWINLLWINKIINVDNGGEFIRESELFNKVTETKGLICVLNSDVNLETYHPKFQFWFDEIYYQLDFVEWGNQAKDEQHLKAIKHYFDNFLFEEGNNLQPILIADAYYLDKSDYIIKKTLNSIGKVGFKNSSKNQYFKPLDDIYMQVGELFPEGDERWELILDIATDSLNEVCNSIDFLIPTGIFHLPEYELNEEEKLIADCSEDLFQQLIDKGLEEKVLPKCKNPKIYLERLEEEVRVIKKGGFISYFLILHDIVKWCAANDIWVGMGRGSAAGSLVSYLLGIVKIDPIHYKLLFSRFLNEGRLSKSLPDVDLDFESQRRDDVKRYMEEKYGRDFVTAIGTYSTFKIKSAIKDIGRDFSVDYSKTNFFVSKIDDSKSNLTGVFKLAVQNAELKQFVQKNSKVFELIPLCMNQVKSSSIHASGVVVVPKNNGNIYQQIPVKLVEGNLVSEWEGEYIDKAGYLKFDILGVKQLDKFSAITKLIKENRGIDVDYDSMTLDNPDVFMLFQEGLADDTFQFGTQGLKAYCKELKPDNINDLIAAVALYRPSTMENGLHKKYIKIKNGLEQPTYDIGTYEATKDTFGIAIYQEQVMRICVDVAGFNLVQADDIRKILGKKLAEEVKEWRGKFVAGGIKNGFESDKLNELWDKLESFAGYGFNLSHAAAYAIMGYYSQWLKVMYPIEFWTVSMQFAEEEEIINRISEISKISTIEVAPVDINHSTSKFFADTEKNIIFWNINSVKYVGEKSVDEILQERKYYGQFFSIEDFCERTSSISAINKRVVSNLILAGAFDKIEKISPENRLIVLKKFYNFTGQKFPDTIIEMERWKPYQWILQQKELTGFGFIDYKKLVQGSSQFATQHKKFKENAEVLAIEADDQDVIVSGILQNVIERKSKKGVFAQLELIDNTDIIYVTVWNETYSLYQPDLLTAKNSIIILNAKIVFDSYKQKNGLHSKNSTKIEFV